MYDQEFHNNYKRFGIRINTVSNKNNYRVGKRQLEMVNNNIGFLEDVKYVKKEIYGLRKSKSWITSLKIKMTEIRIQVQKIVRMYSKKNIRK